MTIDNEAIKNKYQEVKDNVIAVITNADGLEEEITGADFMKLMEETTGEQTPDEYTLEKFKGILKEILEYSQRKPDFFEKQTSKDIIKSIGLIYDFLLWREKEDKAKTEDPATDPAETLPAMGKPSGVNNYVITKDILSKAIFGEPGRNGKKISIVSNKPGTLTLWTTGKGQNKKEVAIYTRLEFDREALKAAGITIGKNVSKRGREVFGAMLSHYLAGNKLLTLGMLGKIIFNTRSDNLTENQKKYIIDGAQEVFGTSLYINTAFSTDEARRAIISLEQAHKVNIERFETLFPGRITSAYINGILVETAIELFRLPTLYSLQKALEKSQILRIPVEALAIPGGRMDEDVIAIRNYLMRRIDIMKHSTKVSRMIIYKNILEEVGIDPTDRAQRTQKTRMLKKVERVLDYWKEYPGEEIHIKDYVKLTKNGQKARGTAPIYEIEIII